MHEVDILWYMYPVHGAEEERKEKTPVSSSNHCCPRECPSLRHSFLFEWPLTLSGEETTSLFSLEACSILLPSSDKKAKIRGPTSTRGLNYHRNKKYGKPGKNNTFAAF